MSRKTTRIDTGGGADLSAANPFAGLQLGGLPQGPSAAPAAAVPPAAPKARGTVLLRRLTGGKGGKVVTEISGFSHGQQDLPQLLKRLQSHLGTGGTCKGAVLELQGECRERLKPLLEAEGYRVKGL